MIAGSYRRIATAGVAAGIAGVLQVALLKRGISEARPFSLALGASASIGIAGGVLLLFRLRSGAVAVAVFVASQLLAGLWFFWLRVQFIIENGGMEGPDGYGSPLAFLIGWIWEQAITTAVGLGLLLLLRSAGLLRFAPRQLRSGGPSGC